jgi:FkbM family methyltransferase
MSREPNTPFDGKATVEDVVSAYRLFLGRNPDPGGLSHYTSLVNNGITLDTLAQHFMESDEYRRRRADEKAVVEVDCGGYVVLVEQGERDFGWKIARHHTWEAHIVSTLRSLLRPGDTFVDIGANVGVMAFAGARAVGPGGRVVAIEPNRDNLQRLYAGIVRNGFGNVRVLPFAASDRAAIFSLAGGTSNTFVTEAGRGDTYAQSVVLDEALVDLDRVDVVKIDIEGHEPHALAGFRRTLARTRPAMLVEYNPRTLRDNAGLDPEREGESLFALLEDVRIVEHSGEQTPVASFASLWRTWESRNRDAVRRGELPEGMLHFDLLGRVRGR